MLGECAFTENECVRVCECNAPGSNILMVSSAQLSALGDQELASISKVVNASFSPKVFQADDQSGRTQHAFSELHDSSKKAAKNFVSLPHNMPQAHAVLGMSISLVARCYPASLAV